MSEKSEQHDSVDESGYKKRCYCQRCEGKYKEWCRKQKEHGTTHCKRRCYTVCEVVCEKPVTTIKHWGFHEKFEGKWEKYAAQPVPKDCGCGGKDGCDCDSKKQSRKSKISQ